MAETADEYKEEYDSRRGSEYSRFHGYTYDGVWAVALAIQHVAHRIRNIRKNQTVSDFQYRDPLWERLFIEALNLTSFEGVTGPVRFYDNERKASILLKQFQNGTEVKVGEYNGVSEELDLNRGRGIRYIKMSSPYLNNLIIIGSMLTYSSVIFLGLDSRLTSITAFPYICTARAWLLMAGFSLAFGAMFSKTWRVHSIFTDVKLNKRVIKDYQLYMVVGVLLVIDLGIMTTWQITDPFFRSTKRMEPYLVELRRNPQGVIDKRIRATLGPRSKTRRDSSELEEQLREAKSSNQTWRKLLLERDAELQALLRLLGQQEDNTRQIAPPPAAELTQLKREPATETTEISSVCSNNSSHETKEEYQANQIDTPAQKKKTIFCNNQTPVAALEEMSSGGSLSVISEAKQAAKLTGHSPASQASSKAVSWEECPTETSSLRRRQSGPRIPSTRTPPPTRRTSVPGRRAPAFVHQDELWLTQRHCKARCTNVSSPDVCEEEVSVIQRSVSERRDKCCHSTTSGGLQQAPRPVGGGSLKKPTPAHVQSTPNVLAGALSEGELLDLSILPIFQKLLTERKGAAIASCPNIAIKCDIVEYL
ncbi:unnamed protein product [Nezara viridula]|uniref:G-protein coupled receptors family 3 profile domain-containing protein n=1 Tax=Nezara viridula TaxID=85310 RepID=A0A9P0H2Y0_NEZVI|nr:unnamed protein product [Nezara viridula]